ncbi:MAG: hypothetical protein ACE5E9_12390 [Nitrospinaceae bacterium]
MEKRDAAIDSTFAAAHPDLKTISWCIVVKVKLENLGPGEVVARDVKDHRGRIILDAGKAIQKKHLKIFKVWGVTEVYLENHQPKKNLSLPDGISSRQLEEIQLEMQKLFRHNPVEHPVLKELFDLCVKRELTHRGGKGEGETQ